MKTASRLGLLLLTSVSIGACGSRPAAGEPDKLNADVQAAGLQRFAVTASSGEMHITPSSDDAIHVQLDLYQDEKSLLGMVHWVSDDTARDLKAATLKLDREGGGLTVTLVYPSGATHSDVKQKWSVSLPARLAVGAEMDAGRIVIEGLEGGVTATLGAGDLDIHTPRGPVHATVSAGRLHVISEGAKPGAISVSSRFGLAILDLDGKYYGPPERHDFMSSFHFWGDSVQQQGGGNEDIQLKVYAGLADLRIGAVGDVKDYRAAFTAE